MTDQSHSFLVFCIKANQKTLFHARLMHSSSLENLEKPSFSSPLSTNSSIPSDSLEDKKVNFENANGNLNSFASDSITITSPSSQSSRSIEIWTLSFVSLAIFTDIVFFGMILPIQRQILIQFGLSPLALFETVVFSSYSIGYLLFTPLFGWLTCSMGRRAPMLVGLTFMVTAELLFAFPIIKGGELNGKEGALNTFTVQNKIIPWPLIQLIFARVLQGGAAGSNWTIGFSMLSDVYEQSRLGWAVGCVFIFHALGYFVGPILGGFLYQYIGYKWPFIICALLTILDFVIRFFLVSKKSQIVKVERKEKLNQLKEMGMEKEKILSTKLTNQSIEKRNEKKTGPDSPISPLSPVSSIDSLGPSNPFNSSSCSSGFEMIFSILKDTKTESLIMAIFLSACSLAIVENLMPDHLQNVFKLSPSYTSLALIAFIGSNALTCFIIGLTVSPFYRHGVITLGLFLHSLFIIWPAFVTNFPLFIIMAICYGSTCAMIANPCIPELGNIADQNKIDYGIVYAIFNLVYSIGMIIGPFGVALMKRESIPFHVAMIPFGITCLVYSGIFYYIHNRN